MTRFPNVPFDVAVVGGGPAGVAAALWAARYRRRVVMVDAGQPRNRWTTATHGYLGLEGLAPGEVLRAARRGLDRYPEVDVVDGRRVVSATREPDALISLSLDDGQCLRALRVILATGVRDVFPAVAHFENYFGRAIFTCPSCDGYEAQGKTAAVVGRTPEMLTFAIGLLDWACSVVAIHEDGDEDGDADRNDGSAFEPVVLDRVPLETVTGRVASVRGEGGRLRSLQLADGRSVPCDVAFWLMRHEQHSDLASSLGCEISPEGCVVVDEHGATTAPNIYAAGDMTPGPHLVQIAAAEGARAGIHAASSLRGQTGSPMSPAPAPDPDDVLDAAAG
jgi:thioredoxin reductase